MCNQSRRAEIRSEMISVCGGIFATKNKLRTVLNISTKGLEEFLSGLEYWNRGGRHYYLISDVAGRIDFEMEHSVRSYTSYSTSLRRPSRKGMTIDMITRDIARNCDDILGNNNYGYWATANEICKVLKINSSQFKLYFGDLESVKIGQKRNYFVQDITKRIRASRGKT